ncbi:MAG TPA: CNNM domain-containing protein [Nitrospiraceae bacterium]|nr:CNNM domain-containing protein [Nitrospiraceae bacterium]
MVLYGCHHSPRVDPHQRVLCDVGDQLVTARKARLQRLVDSGDKAARITVQLGNESTKFLSTVQIGIMAVGMLSGIVGEAALAPPLETWLLQLGISDRASGYTATALVVATITYFAIVIGELVPKRIGQTHAERIARLVARPIRTLAMVSKPFVWPLSASTHLLLRVFTIDDNRRSAVTEDEIHAVLAEGSELGVIELHEHRMVRNLFRLDDLAIVSLMTPRSAIVMLDAAASKLEILAILEGRLIRVIQCFEAGKTTSLAWCRRANCCCELSAARRWTWRRSPSRRCSFPRGSAV